MNLSNVIALRSEGRHILAGAMPKADAKYTPVHAGAHDHLTKIGYMHTGNKTRGGITTSNYFKSKMGNTRNIAVQKDGSFIKTSKTAKGTRRSRGKLDACGLKMHAGGPGSGRHAGGGSAEEMKPHPYSTTSTQQTAKSDSEHNKAADFHEQAALYHHDMANGFKDTADDAKRTGDDKGAKIAQAQSDLHEAAASAHDVASAWHRQDAVDGESSTRSAQLSERAGYLSLKADNPNYR